MKATSGFARPGWYSKFKKHPRCIQSPSKDYDHLPKATSCATPTKERRNCPHKHTFNICKGRSQGYWHWTTLTVCKAKSI